MWKLMEGQGRRRTKMVLRMDVRPATTSTIMHPSLERRRSRREGGGEGQETVAEQEDGAEARESEV